MMRLIEEGQEASHTRAMAWKKTLNKHIHAAARSLMHAVQMPSLSSSLLSYRGYRFGNVAAHKLLFQKAMLSQVLHVKVLMFIVISLVELTNAVAVLEVLKPNGTEASGQLDPGTWKRFQVPDVSGECERAGFVTFRVWDTSRVMLQNETSSTKASHGADALLIAGEGTEYLDTWKTNAPAFVSARQNYWAVADGLHADFTGFQILRPYHTVVRPLASNFSLAVYNVDEWVQTKLNYVVTAECSGSLGTCVRPRGPGTSKCAGLGTCTESTGICTCDYGRGGIGCEYEMEEIAPEDSSKTVYVDGSQWKYFIFYGKKVGRELISDSFWSPNSMKTVTITMTRLKGQTVLFSKKRTEGQSPYGMINIYDYNLHADVNSYKNRRSEHTRSFHIDMNDENDDGVYYLAIFNNNNPIYGTGSAIIRVTEEINTFQKPGLPGVPVSPSSDANNEGDGSSTAPASGNNESGAANSTQPLFPSEPLPYPVDIGSLPALLPDSVEYTTCAAIPCYFGTCQLIGVNPTCICATGYGGSSCNTPLAPITLGERISGTVPGGMWKYHILKLGHPSLFGGTEQDYSVQLPQPFTNDIMVTFKRYGGSAVLVAKRGMNGVLPDTQINDFLFTTPYYNPNIEQFKVGAYDLYMGNYIFAVHNAGNIGTYMSYVLSVELTREESWFPKSMLHLAIGVFAAFCLLVLFIICKKVTRRNANMTIVQAVINAVTLAGGRQGNTQRSGLDTETIESFETFTYTPDTQVKGGEQCMVCLSDFENGDELRLMPGCGHAFHSKCVDPWLQQSHTCPTCRRELQQSHGTLVDGSSMDLSPSEIGMTAIDGNSVNPSNTGSLSGAGDVHVVISDVDLDSSSPYIENRSSVELGSLRPCQDTITGIIRATPLFTSDANPTTMETNAHISSSATGRASGSPLYSSGDIDVARSTEGHPRLSPPGTPEL